MFSNWVRPLALCMTCLAAIVNLAMCCGSSLAAPSVDQIAAMLPEQPRSLGRSIDDRQTWDALAATEGGRAAIRAAAELLDRPMEEFDRELYLEYFENGNRTRYQSHASKRWARLRALVLAEILEDRGRFVEAIEEAAASLCRAPSWVLPAHDRGKVVVEGKTHYVDLAAASSGHDMAVAYSLLGERLSDSTRTLMVENLQRRVIEPTFRAIREPQDKAMQQYHGWRRRTNNWNSVCTAGVTGVILAIVESRAERADAVAAALENTEYFLRGFTDDGYCSEGLSYWSYGFSHFAVLRQLLHEQSAGQIDLFDDAKAKAAARFPLQIEILDGAYPAFADAAVAARPDEWSMRYLGWRPVEEPGRAIGSSGTLYQAMIGLFSPAAGGQGDRPEAEPLRSRFDEGGVFIARPSQQTKRRFAVALKAGHNNEHHNHNDVGSYVVVLDGEALLLDPGSMEYTADTFSSRRYRYSIMNSFGHPVPVVNGMLQRTGAKARGKVLACEQLGEADRLALDLSSCYDDPNLTKLVRTWTYDRAGDGSLLMQDEVTFRDPGRFETALIGAADWRRGGDGVLYVRGSKGGALRVRIDCESPYELQPVRLENPGKYEPVRVGVRLREPVSEAAVTLRIEPCETAEAEAAEPIAVERESTAKAAGH